MSTHSTPLFQTTLLQYMTSLCILGHELKGTRRRLEPLILFPVSTSESYGYAIVQQVKKRSID